MCHHFQSSSNHQAGIIQQSSSWHHPTKHQSLIEEPQVFDLYEDDTPKTPKEIKPLDAILTPIKVNKPCESDAGSHEIDSHDDPSQGIASQDDASHRDASHDGNTITTSLTSSSLPSALNHNEADEVPSSDITKCKHHQALQSPSHATLNSQTIASGEAMLSQSCQPIASGETQITTATTIDPSSMQPMSFRLDVDDHPGSIEGKDAPSRYAQSNQWDDLQSSEDENFDDSSIEATYDALAKHSSSPANTITVKEGIAICQRGRIRNTAYSLCTNCLSTLKDSANLAAGIDNQRILDALESMPIQLLHDRSNSANLLRCPCDIQHDRCFLLRSGSDAAFVPPLERFKLWDSNRPPRRRKHKKK